MIWIERLKTFLLDVHIPSCVFKSTNKEVFFILFDIAFSSTSS